MVIASNLANWGPDWGQIESKVTKVHLEECESGRIGRSRKPLWSQGHRGFESHLLRARCHLINVLPGSEPSCLSVRSQGGGGLALDPMPMVDRAIPAGDLGVDGPPDVPVAVVLVEAVELAKQYSTKQSGGVRERRPQHHRRSDSPRPGLSGESAGRPFTDRMTATSTIGGCRLTRGHW